MPRTPPHSNEVTRLRTTAILVIGFLAGLTLASLNHLLPEEQATQGVMGAVVVFVDWTAPPLAGLLTAAAMVYALRHQRLLASEQAASQILAERLAGTERRQAIWVVAAAVAHDLKNPLHNIQLLLEEMESDPSLAAEMLPRVRANAARAADRLAELQRVGQSREGDAEPLELRAVMEQLRERLQAPATSARTTLQLDCPRGLLVRADPLALRSAVENVAANALEAIEERGAGGRLTLRAARVGPDTIELWVEDDGPGIPLGLRERLFTPFVSGSDQGTGLGLAIARAIARSEGGDLICHDAGPGGARFRFTFPSQPAS